jgi:predicted DsbA family dithiol-disulfide isomerase
VLVEVWSDVVCPWCYVGKRRFEAALSRFAHRDEVEVRWRSFQLDPTTVSATGRAAGPSDDHARVLAAKFGMPLPRAASMLEELSATAAAEGLDLHPEVQVPANTLDAHRVLHLAAERGVQGAVKERLLLAHFTQGEALGDAETLVRLAAEAGLDPEEVREVLAGDRYAAEVRADVAEASALGARGVPFFVVDRRYGVAGAQPTEEFLAVLEQAWSERVPTVLVPAGGAADACGPDGCAI